MMEKLNGTLQESIITLLAHDDVHGKIIANVVSPVLFEGDYRTIAERCVDYWNRHGEAPKFHTDDLVADVLSDPKNRRAQTYRRILTNMLTAKEHINTGYVIAQLQRFSRMQRYKDAIIKSAEALQSEQEMALEEVEALWNGLLKVREITFIPGMRLHQIEDVLTFMERQQSEFMTGIAQFDRVGFVPARGAVMLLLAAAKKGKSWALVHIGKQALMQRKKVVHISLEMGEEETLQRYYQSLFAVTKYADDEVFVQELKLDDRGYLDDWEEQEIEPDFTLQDRNVREELEAHVQLLGAKAENLIVKRFPARSVGVREIDAYLDNLEIVDKFIPDMLILDYVGILKTDAKNHRISLGREVEEFRALCVRRNLAGVTAHQISRAGAEALFAKSTHIAEDWSMVGTMDRIAVYSATSAERRLGLGRMMITEHRGGRDNFGVLMTQSYATGQFVINSALLDSKYFEMLEDIKDGDDEEGDYGDDEQE